MQRLLLLTTAYSYRNEAFRSAAARAGVEIVTAYDRPPAWQAPPAGQGEEPPAHPGSIGVDLADPAAAAETVAAFAAAFAAAYAEEQPLAAVLPVDDSGVVAAAAVAAAAGAGVQRARRRPRRRAIST